MDEKDKKNQKKQEAAVQAELEQQLRDLGVGVNELKDTVHIFQAQKDQLILTQNTYNITSEKQDILVELKSKRS